MDRKDAGSSSVKSAYRILIPLAIAILCLLLWEKGYAFGQWLYAKLN